MRTLKLLVALWAIPYIVLANTSINDDGIAFVKANSFEEIKALAKATRKNIFIDAYATWCSPCKLMDQDIYPRAEVGRWYNANFISVKVQMDQTRQDTEPIKMWYKDAKWLQEHFGVTTFPSYLFLDANGVLLHRAIGLLTADQFLKLGMDAIDPNRNFNQQVILFKEQKIAVADLGKFALLAKKMKADSIGLLAAQQYKTKYLDHVVTDILLQSENLNFIKKFPNLVQVGDSYFRLFYQQGDTINKLLKSTSFADAIINWIITRDVLNPVLYDGNSKPKPIQPNWKEITAELSERFPDRVVELMIGAKLRWYTMSEDLPNIVKYSIQKTEVKPLDTTGMGWLSLNNMVYSVILKNTNDKQTLNKARKWMEQAVKAQPHKHNYWDTYAGVLYKLGKKDDALKQQLKAIEVLNEQIKRYGEKDYLIKDKKPLQQNLERIAVGTLSW